MSHSKQHVIVFCLENQLLADQIAKDFAQGGLQLEKKGFLDSTGLQTLQQAVTKPSGVILLLITDNFLKAPGCMYGSLAALKEWSDSGKLIPVVADGRRRKPDGGWEIFPTSFDRVSSIIQYMNFWQDQYLELRKEKRLNDDDPMLDQQIEITKAISAEAGEFLRYLRNVSYYTLDEFKADHYQIFRNITGTTTIFGEENKQVTERAQPKPPAATDESLKERTLAEIIQDSEEDLIAENANLLTPSEDNPPAPLEEYPDVWFEVKKSSEEHEKRQAPADEADDIEDLLNEVLEEEDDLEEPVFLGDDPDNPEDFDLDSLFDEEELTSAGFEKQSEEDFNEEEEILLDLVSDDEDGLVLNADGVSHTTPDEILDYALDLLDNGKNEEGLRYLKKTMELNPNDNRLRYYYAYAIARYENDFDGAVHHLESILAKDKKFADAWFLLGEISENEGDYLEAKHYFEKVLQLEPDYENAHFRLGLLTLQHFEGQQVKAAEYFKKTVELDKKNADAHYLLATLLHEHLDDPQKAIKHFKKTLKYQPEHPFANYDLALLYHKLGERALAGHYYERATEVNPELKTARNDEAFRFEPALEADLEHPQPEEPIDEEGFPTDDDQIGEGPQENTEEIPTPEEAADEDTVFLKIARPLTAPKEEDAPEPAGEAESEETGDTIEEVAEEDIPVPPAVQLKTVLISGATSGIGKATAEIFARNGYRVIITGRRNERLEEMKQDFKTQFNNEILTLNFDIRDLEAVKSAIENLPDDWKNIDILINNAGLSRGLAPIHEGRIEHWETMIDTNIKGLLYLTRAITPHMVERRSGHIINVASSAGKEVYPGGNVYCATKFAVDALTQAMRLDLYTHNIRVSQVAPGHVEETEFARVRFDWDTERAAKVYENFQPLKSSDVAEVIYFIATRPPHVNIQDVLMFSTQQAGSNFIDRSGR